jgi:hypothetical protein
MKQWFLVETCQVHRELINNRIIELCGVKSPEFMQGMKETLNYPQNLVERFKNGQES